jgi:pyrimidine operon attenuation protein/uracil phosphoribosyltransferase
MTTADPGRSAAKVLLDAPAVERTLSRIAHELIERNADLASLALVGIHTRGVPLARRLQQLVARQSGVEVDLGAVDITFHRDDVLVRGGGAPLHPQPVVRGTELDFPLEGKTVVLVDDVLFTGRTVRAALDQLIDFGRPARIELAVLVDRGHRELPIRADYVGRSLATSRDEQVQVAVREEDGKDEVVLMRKAAAAGPATPAEKPRRRRAGARPATRRAPRRKTKR